MNHSTPPGQHPDEDEGLDLRPIVRKLWQQKWLVLGILAASLACGAVYYLLATRWYETSVVLLPRDTKGSGGAASQLGQLGGLASLAGISVGAPVREEPLAILRSKGFARKFIEQNQLDRVIFADEWDAERGQWQAGTEEGDHDIRDAVDRFQKKILTITEDKKSGLVTISVVWKSATLAASWANLFARQINDEMRLRTQSESEGNIKYLSAEMEKSNILSIREAQGRLLESELQKLVMARGNEEFAYRVIDKAYAPKKQKSPMLALVALVALLLGAVVAMVVVFRRELKEQLSLED